MKFLVLLPIAAFFLYHDLRLRKRGRLEKETVTLHCDMWDKMRELFDDPCMSYLKWKEWLPVFEAADKRCENLDHDMAARLGRVSDHVRKIISDDGYQRDVQRR